MPEVIDLAVYTANGKVRNLSGKDRGLAARARFGMDEMDRGNDVVKVEIPRYVYAISTSFFCGMFGDSYKNLGGRTGVLGRYSFSVSRNLWPQIEQGLQRCSYDFQHVMTSSD